MAVKILVSKKKDQDTDTHSRTTWDSTIMFFPGVTRLYRDLATGVPDREVNARGIYPATRN